MKSQPRDPAHPMLRLVLTMILASSCQVKDPLQFEIPKALLESALQAPPNAFFAQSEVIVNENAGSARIRLRLSAPSPLTVRVPVSPTSEIPGFSRGFAVFNPGSTEAEVVIPVSQDSIINSASPRNTDLQIGLPEYAIQGLPATMTLRIVDDDRPVVRFTALDRDFSESQGSVTLTAVSDRPFSGQNPVNVPIQLSGSASNGSDYSLSSTNLSFPPGASSASVTVNLTNNSTVSDLKNIVFTLSRLGNSTYDLHPTENRAQIVIRDDEGPLRIGFPPLANLTGTGTNSQSIRLPESAGNLQVPVLLNRPATTSVSVPVTIMTNPTAVSGVDYMLFSSQVTVQAGNTRGILSFSLIDNLSFKGSRSFTLQLGSPNGGATLGSISRLNVEITDNETAPTIEFQNLSLSRSENSGIVEIPVVLSSLSTATVTGSTILGSDASGTTLLGDAIRGQDFSVTSANFSISAGAVRGLVRITLLNDSLNEDTETMVGVLDNASSMGATVRAAGTTRTSVFITDDDPNVSIAWDTGSQTVAESSGKAIVKAKLDGPAGKTVHVPFSISGTAQPGIDHELTPREIIIEKGGTEGTLEVPLIKDSASSPDKTIILTLQDSGNALIGTASQHTVTVTDASGITPSITAFQTTVYAYVNSQACVTCHNSTGISNIPFASENLQDAFNTALLKTDFDNISNSRLVTKLMAGETLPHPGFANLQNTMITKITEWKNGSTGGSTSVGSGTGSSSGPGSTGTTLVGGSVGIQDFVQIEATLSSATQTAIPPLNQGGTYNILRANISADGDPLGISAPMAGAYIGLGAHYCKTMIDEVSNANSTNKRGFNMIQGLSNFNAASASFSPAMQAQVTQRFAELLWQRAATTIEVEEVQALVNDLRVAAPTITTKLLGIAMCSAMAGSLEAIDN